jgi:hypothetical protein
VIARFRKRHRGDLETLFVEVLKLCHAAGLARLGVVALNGTKVSSACARVWLFRSPFPRQSGR